MLPLTLKTLSDLVEKHLDYGNAQESMFLKLMGARWTNTAIAARGGVGGASSTGVER